jgi:alpha-1,6-mannosyltransferase
MTHEALVRPRAPAVPRAPRQRLLAAVALTLTTVSIVVFAALSASGDRVIVAPSGPPGPFADLHSTLAPQLVKAACWLAAATGGAGVAAGLAAARRGWRPRPGLLLAACTAAVAVFVLVPPAASIDVQNYAEYGRIVVLGHNPWVMTPQQLHELGDPVGLLRPTQWENQPTVYGPAATAVEAAAAWLGAPPWRGSHSGSRW